MTLVNYSIGGSTFAQSSNFGGLYESYAAFIADETKDTSKIYVVMTGNQTYQDYAYANGAWSTTNVQVRTPISARYQLMDDDADIVCVACGTNDFQYNWTPLGTMSDRTPDTFYGALHYTILGLLQKYLGKQIIICTPIKRCQSPYTTIESVNDYNKTLEQYGQIIKEVCSYYSIPVIDLYSESGLNPHIQSQSSLFDSYKTHPYQKGHDMIARVVTGKIQSLRGSSF
jgi:lysophospholipase L1-like esterase